jgi:hypothetical protein
MSKKNDRHSMAEGYLAQAEWESSHPLDRRGRPPAKYQPTWKYQRAYPKPYKIPVFLWIILIPIIIACLGTAFFTRDNKYPGVGIAGIITVLSTIILFYFLTRPSKKK